MSLYSVGILTVSDSIQAGQALDKSGPAVMELLAVDAEQWSITETAIVADNVDQIQGILKLWASHRKLNLVLTIGGTGFGPRDVTPEAVRPLLGRYAPGLEVAMLTSSLQKTPLAALSRPVCGVRGTSLIITLPGSPKGAVENLGAILMVLPHAIELLRGNNPTHDILFAPNAGVRSSEVNSRTGPSLDNSVNIVAASNVKKGTAVSPATTHSSSTVSSNPISGANSQLMAKKSFLTPYNTIKSLSTAPVAVSATSDRESPYPLIAVDEAIEKILFQAQPLPVKTVRVSEELLGYVLAETVTAIENVPNFPASMMDGYAVHANEGPGVFPVRHSNFSAAGEVAEGTMLALPAGQISKIMTGAPVPPGATAVIPVEHTRVRRMDQRKEAEVEILRGAAKEGEHIRQIGSDFSVGDVILRTGEQISEVGGELGALISAGIPSVQVFHKPVVGVLSTGNELVESDQDIPLNYGQVRDANRPALMSAILAAGFEVLNLGIAPDREDALENILHLGLERCDVVVTSGGVSMGDLDLVKSVIEQRLKGTIHFGRVNMKPGKPTTFATVPRPSSPSSGLVFALPGNPVSALVTFHLFVLPALKRMAGLEQALLPGIRVKLAHEVSLDFRPEFQRAFLQVDGSNFLATTTGSQQSSRLLSLSGAKALLCLPSLKTAGVDRLSKGEWVDALLLGKL